MAVEALQYQGDMHTLRMWAINRGGNIEPPDPYYSWVRKILPAHAHHQIGYHMSFHRSDSPTTEDGWCLGFPHSHVSSVNWPPDSASLMLYLAVADEGGEICIGGLGRDDPYDVFQPKIGDAFLIDGLTWHGVRPVKRGTRVMLLASGIPEPKEKLR